MSSGEVKPLGPFQLQHVSTWISRIFLMTWVCSPSLCKCAASWVASLANPVIAIWVSPGEPEDVLNFSSSRHISSICGALDFDPYAIGCFKMFQDPLSIVQLFLNWLHLQNGSSKPFFLVHPLVHHKIWSVWNIVKSISIISKFSFYFILNPLMLVSSTQISTTWTQHPLDVRKDAESVGLPRRILQLGVGHLGAKRQNLPSK